MEWINENIGLLIGVILTLGNIGKWVWVHFNKAYKLKKGSEDFHAKVERHDVELCGVTKKFDDLMEMVNTLFEINKIQTRYSIVSACNEALENECIEQYQLQAIEDMYTMYTEILKGNSYVTTLVKKVRRLEIHNRD